MMGERAAIVLAGGTSERFRGDKALISVAGKPMVYHVVASCKRLVGEVMVVVNDHEQLRAISSSLPEWVTILTDDVKRFPAVRSPLLGMVTGLSHAHSKYAAVLPCDAPFVNGEIINYLFQRCLGKDAAIPRWPNGNIEPLHAVYRVKPALEAGEKALRRGDLNVRSMIDNLENVVYVHTEELTAMDPNLLTLINVNDLNDLAMVRKIAEEKAYVE
jgi:molybdopterin-guanine dinucleotide biosynthesis protein A